MLREEATGRGELLADIEHEQMIARMIPRNVRLFRIFNGVYGT